MPSPFHRMYFDMATAEADEFSDYCRVNRLIKKNVLADLVNKYMAERKAEQAAAAAKVAKASARKPRSVANAS